MTYVRSGHEKRSTPHWGVSSSPSLGSALIIDATGEMIGFVGQVWNKDGTSKNITKLHWRWGGCTKAGGSGLTASLQNVDLTAGGPGRPDGTQDQTVAIAAAAVTQNTWFTSGALSASRTVAYGEFLAVVIEFDGSGRLGADSFTIAGPGTSQGLIDLRGAGVLKTGGTWALAALLNFVILEFDDGTFGTLAPGVCYESVTTTTFNSGSAADEIALKFTVPAKCKVDGAVVVVNVPATNVDFDVVLYDGTTVLATVSVDGHQLKEVTTARELRVNFPQVELLSSGTYYLSVKPTTANSVTVYDLVVNAANHLQAYPQGTSWHFASRVDAGAWTAVTTRVPVGFGLLISEIDDGAGGGGSGGAHFSAFIS